MKSYQKESSRADMALNFAIAAVLLWIGFVCAISFMEAWLKFRAPGVTLATGLSIGKIVFAALNRVEIVLGATALVSIIAGNSFTLRRESWLLVAIAILIVQTFWILPLLTARIEIYLRGETPPQSNLHFYFIGMEVCKVCSLAVYAARLLGTKTLTATTMSR